MAKNKRRRGRRRASSADQRIRRAGVGRELREAYTARRRDNAATSEPAGTPPDFLTWAQQFPMVNGSPFDFDRFPFQREMYEVFADPTIKQVVVMKATQVGVSELLARWALYYADTFGVTALYYFPANTQMADFSATRVDPLCERSPYLRERAGRPWSTRTKRIGDGVVHYRGAESMNDVISVAADILALDEFDRLPPGHVAEAEQRIGGSQLALIRRVGVPSDPEFGIADCYRRSDQREWHVSCGHCGQEQQLAFDANVRWEEEDETGHIVNARRVCRLCEQEINVGNGHWIAAHPGRPIVGFQVSRLMLPDADLVAIVLASKERHPDLVERFHRNTLGLPYADTSGGLDRAAVLACVSAATSYNNGTPMLMEHDYVGTNIVTAGIDVASVRAIHVRISEHLDPPGTRGGRKRALRLSLAGSFEELKALMNRYNVNFAVIDHAPDGRLAQALVETFPGRVYVAHYMTNPLRRIHIDLERSAVAIDRVTAMDATAHELRTQRNLLPEDLPRGYVEQMVAPRRVTVPDRYNRPRPAYESHRADDYFHAETFDWLAAVVADFRLEWDEHMARDGERFSLLDYLEMPRSTLGLGESGEYRPAFDNEYSSGFDDDDDRRFDLPDPDWSFPS